MIEELEKIIGYEFKDKNILRQAVTHSSYANYYNKGDYERLEFLGDSILGMIITQELFLKFPQANVGDLTETRKSLVSADILAEIVIKHGLQKFVLTRRLSAETGKIVSDIFESLVAAIFVDGGLENSSKFIREKFGTYLSEVQLLSKFDALTTLKEMFDKGGDVLRYDCEQEPDTMLKPIFLCKLYLNDKLRAEAQGNSKKEAQQLCAKRLLEDINKKKDIKIRK